MSKIIYLPLEHIESRYTVHMDRDILTYLDESGEDYIRIYPDIPSPQTMKAGSFLDAEFTIRFKAAQIAEVARLYREDTIDSGDIVWSSDLWHPGLPESIAYMNYFAKKDVKLRGLIHAGSWTDTDFRYTEGRYLELPPEEGAFMLHPATAIPAFCGPYFPYCVSPPASPFASVSFPPHSPFSRQAT